jgi:coenzyme F420 hydrogenase subunit beta
MDIMDIRHVVTKDLCHGCGTCAGICPKGAVRMVVEEFRGIYVPTIDMKECNSCTLCYQSCPGHFVDFEDLDRSFLYSPHLQKDILLSSYHACYTGYANDYQIRYSSASGGLVTAMLVHLLEQGVIDGALVTKMDEDNPLRPQPFIARSREEIIDASKSKYCPVALNSELKEILREKGRFAVVGLPCHVQGIRKAQKIDEGLKERIVIVLGIFCGMAWNFRATETLLQKLNILVKDVDALSYRGGGWPGKMLIKLKDGGLKELPYPYPLNKFDIDFKSFTPSRCILCTDALSELADVSFGDADFSLRDKEKIGKSVVITRSLAGEQLLQSAIAEKLVELEKITGEDIIQLRKNLLLRKKKTVMAHFTLYKLLGREIPRYNQTLIRPGIGDYLSVVSLHVRNFISKRKKLKRIFPLFRYMRNKI